MNKLSKFLILIGFAGTFTSCGDKEDPIIIVPVSAGSKLTLEGGPGGSSAANSVFVDFSEDKQSSVARAAWDLGFYSGPDDFRVIINHSTGAAAKQIDKTDLNQVTALDTISLALSGEMNIGIGFSGKFERIDPVEGNRSTYLAGTVIKAISATESENKVYIYARGTSGVANRGWQKIRILRNGSGYTLQYAKINETKFKTLNVPKEAANNFNFISFEGGIVGVEPAKNAWDIQWGLTTFKASPTIPYIFSDFVLINFVGGAEAAQVLTSTISYTDFKESNLSSITFSSNREVIAGNWRVTSGGTIGVRTDRFYVVKDPSGNVYKLKFISFHPNDGGERGKPVIEYALVKKA
jgi:hypothetical protein